MNQKQIAGALQGLQRCIEAGEANKHKGTAKEPQIQGSKFFGHLSKRLKKHIEPYHPTVNAEIEKIKQHRGTTIFYGPNRTGKSSLAASIAWVFGETAKFTYAFTYLQEIKQTFDGKSVFSIPSHKLMILDEYEKFNTGEWASTMLDRTICHRHDDMLANIIITNLSLPEIKEAFSGSLISRCMETGQLIEIKKPWWK